MNSNKYIEFKQYISSNDVNTNTKQSDLVRANNNKFSAPHPQRFGIIFIFIVFIENSSNFHKTVL